MSLWTISLPDANRPVWHGRNFGWYALASLGTFRALCAARWRLRTLLPRDIGEANDQAARDGLAPDRLDKKGQAFVEQMRRVVPRIARLCPFRSDCLVQALAGQELLLNHRIASRIVLAAENVEAGNFQPHALLMVDDIAVTGGDPGQFTALYGEIEPDESSGKI